MTIKKAKECLTNLQITYSQLDENTSEMFGIAVASLEKQIPKKPIGFNALVGRHPNQMLLDDYESHKCPSCGDELWGSLTTKERYCHNCGQRLNWGEEKTDDPR